MAMKPNIILLVIDSLRSDQCHGKQKTSITPNIDSLIKRGVYFPQTISSIASTSPSMGSMFTGVFPFRTGMSRDVYEKLNSTIPTFIEHFKNNGYSTFATTSEVNSFLGLTEDFDLKLESSTHDNYFSLFDGLGEKILAKIDSALKEPWFFYIHINDLHQPIVVPKDFDDTRFGETTYERMVSSIDAWVGDLLKKIDLKDTLLVITADHGEYIRSLKIDNEMINLESGMGEKTLWRVGNKIPHSLYGPKRRISSYLSKIRNSRREKKIKNLSLSKYEKRALTTSRMSQGSHIYDDVLKVPLLFAGYDIKSDKVVPQQVGLIDVFPTITELIGLENLASEIDGTSLIPLFTDKHIDEKPIFIQSMPHISENHKNYVGIRTGQFKYVRDRDNDENFELFDLINDPLEESDVSDDLPEIATRMENILKNCLKKEIKHDSKKLDDAERNRVEKGLKKLGYI